MELNDIADMKKSFRRVFLDIIEKGIVNKKFKMVELARCLGVSSQVASKLVAPKDTRMPTVFEAFRLSVLLRTPLENLVPKEMYMALEELDDEELCVAMGISEKEAICCRKLLEIYEGMGKVSRRHLLEIAKLLSSWENDRE